MRIGWKLWYWTGSDRVLLYLSKGPAHKNCPEGFSLSYILFSDFKTDDNNQTYRRITRVDLRIPSYVSEGKAVGSHPYADLQILKLKKMLPTGPNPLAYPLLYFNNTMEVFLQPFWN